jgi:hypothetical protein
MAKKKTAASHIGTALAHLQDTIDIAVSWGFHKLKKVKLDEEADHPAKSNAKKVATSFFKFYGELGETFYDEYEKLKKDRQSKK